MSEFSKNEGKLIKKMLDENDSCIQLMTVNKSYSLVCIGESRIQSNLLIIACFTDDGRVCAGYNVSKNFIFSSLDEDAESRILIDRRKEDNRKSYIICNGKEGYFSEDTEQMYSEGALMVYFETEDFARLTLFNNALDQEVAKISANNLRVIGNVWDIARKFVNVMLPWKRLDQKVE
ncbi:hypothetical protein ACTFOB_07800 [Bacillus cereus group sp. MYBK79-1]|uniref:hypothetical protein n=1 Tax=unclassified Bacillus cereus group TaxID=2750818 RepID=UPI003F78D09B